MGFFRLYLACIVVATHTWFEAYGIVAVYCFFALSGFLVTQVLNETYGSSFNDRLRFLANRALRIYPMYWACLLISIVGLLYWQGACTRFHITRLPGDFTGWISNISIFGLEKYNSDRRILAVIPVAWSLNIELFYYLVIGLLIGTNKRLCVLSLFVAIGVTGWIIGWAEAKKAILQSYQAGFLPFMAGCCAYHYRQYLIPAKRPVKILLLSASVLVITLPPLFRLLRRHYLSIDVFDIISVKFKIYLFATSIIFSLSLPVLRTMSFRRAGAQLNHLAGAASYPLFLLHVFIAHSLLCFMPALKYGFSLFIITLTVSMIAGLILHVAVEVPLLSLRSAIRRKEPPRSKH